MTDLFAKHPTRFIKVSQLIFNWVDGRSNYSRNSHKNKDLYCSMLCLLLVLHLGVASCMSIFNQPGSQHSYLMHDERPVTFLSCPNPALGAKRNDVFLDDWQHQHMQVLHVLLLSTSIEAIKQFPFLKISVVFHARPQIVRPSNSTQIEN